MRLRETFRRRQGKTLYGYEVVNDNNSIDFELYPIEVERVVIDGFRKFKISVNLEYKELLQERIFTKKEEAFNRVETFKNSRMFKSLVLRHIENHFCDIILNSGDGEKARNGMRMILENLQGELHSVERIFQEED